MNRAVYNFVLVTSSADQNVSVDYAIAANETRRQRIYKSLFKPDVMYYYYYYMYQGYYGFLFSRTPTAVVERAARSCIIIYIHALALAAAVAAAEAQLNTVDL